MNFIPVNYHLALYLSKIKIKLYDNAGLNNTFYNVEPHVYSKYDIDYIYKARISPFERCLYLDSDSNALLPKLYKVFYETE